MAIPKEEQGHRQNRDAVVNFIGRDKMTGRVDQRPVLVEGLPKAAKSGMCWPEGQTAQSPIQINSSGDGSTSP